MSRTKLSLLLDLGCISGLLGFAALPLIKWRGDPFLHTNTFTYGFWSLGLLGCVVWCVLQRRLRAAPPPPDDLGGTARSGWRRGALVVALLATLTAASYYQPLKKQFWGGADEFCNFEDAKALWSDGFDAFINRPFIVAPAVLAKALTPDRIQGFLWVAALLCLANGLLLYGALRQAWPGACALPAAAAALLVVNRADSSRFYVMWTTNFYWSALAFFLLGLWLLLLSYRRGSRALLALACLSLAGALLINEGVLPLAGLALVLLWLVRGARGRGLVWTYAWLGTMTLLAARFALFLLARGENSYQAAQAAGALRQPELLLASLRLHLGTFLNYFQRTASAGHGQSALVALAAAAALVGLALGRRPARRRGYLLALPLAAAAMVLGTAPFLHIQAPFRTEFFTAPGQAVLLACGICLAAELLGRWVGVATAAAAVGLLAANCTRETCREQDLSRAQHPINFEKTVHVFQQIHALAPALRPDTLVLLVLDENIPTPLGANYCCVLASRCFLGAPTIQATLPDTAQSRPIFKKDTVTALNCGWCEEAPYDHLLAFRLALDGSVSLLRHLPTALLPPGHSGSRYDPRAVVRPGPIHELPYLRYPRWSPRPRDLFTMADGVVLGQGWGPLESASGKRFRRAAPGAELAVNPLGRARGAVTLDVESDPPGRAGRLEVLDEGGRMVASAPVAGRQVVRLALPADPARIGLFALRFQAEGGPPVAGACRAYCREKCRDALPTPPPAPPDIAAAGLRLGASWHGPEGCAGEVSRRAAEGAEVVLGLLATAHRAVALDVVPTAGGTCWLEVRDEAGRVLAEARLQGRGAVRVPLPAEARPGGILRLHSGRDRVPTLAETPPLDVRVFSCRPTD
jgi:hypothetical protein